MFELQIDAKPFEEMVDRMGDAIDQMPFALSRALNDAAFDTRQKLIDQTWPAHVTVRNSGFLAYALRIERSDKQNLKVAIYDQGSKGHVRLDLHAQGGVKTSVTGRFAIPTKAVTLGAQGVRSNQKPRNLANKVVIGNAIYQQQGRGKHNRKLVKMFTLTTAVKQPADIPFQLDFETAMRESVATHFPQRMREAMATRR